MANTAFCKGYMVPSEDYQVEELFAVLDDGRVAATGEIPVTSYFGKFCFSWIDALPDNAQFIGTYRTPVII